MEISVVIPTYNRADLLGETVESILSQSYPPREIVICDDGSRDNTREIASGFGPLVTYIQIENSGPAIARKIAIDNSTSPWIAPCDSDDIWEKNHLEDLVALKNRHQDLDVLFSNFKLLNTNESRTKFDEAPAHWWDNITESFNQPYRKLAQDAYVHLLEFQPCFPSCMAFSRNIYEKIGGIDPAIGRIASEDAHLSRRLFSHGKVGCSDAPTVNIRRHEGNYSADVIKNMLGRLQILELLINKEQIKKHHELPTAEEITRSYQSTFDMCYWHGSYDQAQMLYHKIKIKNIRIHMRYLACLTKKALKHKIT